MNKPAECGDTAFSPLLVWSSGGTSFFKEGPVAGGGGSRKIIRKFQHRKKLIPKLIFYYNSIFNFSVLLVFIVHFARSFAWATAHSPSPPAPLIPPSPLRFELSKLILFGWLIFISLRKVREVGRTDGWEYIWQRYVSHKTNKSHQRP